MRRTGAFVLDQAAREWANQQAGSHRLRGTSEAPLETGDRAWSLIAALSYALTCGRVETRAFALAMPSNCRDNMMLLSNSAILWSQSIYGQKLSALAELKQSILQKAFASELTAQPEQILQEAVA
jgi:hypothetical protein